MAQVFVSYARKDQEFVLKLAQDLRRRGVDLWLDQLDIGEGRWDDQVQTALESCPCFLIVLSPASAGSENVKDELNFALDEQKTIIPVLYQECTIPFRIRRFQRVDFQHNYEHALIRLCDFLPEFSKKSRPKLNVEFSPGPQEVVLGEGVIKRFPGLIHDLKKILGTIFQPQNVLLSVIGLVLGLTIVSGVYFKDSILEMAQGVYAGMGSFSKGKAWAGTIAFSSYRNGNWDIYTLTPDATLTRLTNNRFLDRFPAWSPDGSRLAFVSNRDGNMEIYTLAATGVATRMTKNLAVDREPAWSPDGSRLAFVSYRDGNGEIYTLNTDGSLTRLTNNPAEDREPAWSPDGSFIAFASNRASNWDIYTLDARGEVRRLTAHPAEDREPAWSPDGSKLAFASDRDGNWEIYTLDSAGITVRMTNNPADDREVVWSPDGLSLAFTSNRAAPGPGIYALDATGGTRLLTDNGTDENPDWAR